MAARAAPSSPSTGHGRPKRKHGPGVSISGLSSEALPCWLSTPTHEEHVQLAFAELIHKCSRSSCGERNFPFGIRLFLHVRERTKIWDTHSDPTTPSLWGFGTAGYLPRVSVSSFVRRVD